MQAPEIIDCTCTVASISSKSRFACANVWSVRVVTKSIYMTFVGICFAFVNICQKKKEKREKNEKRVLCFIQKSYMYMYVKKSGILVCNLFLFHAILGLDLQFKPLFFNFFLWYGRLSKAYALNCSCFAKGAQNTLNIQKKRKNEL